MPFYHIHHVTSLSSDQRQALAKFITNLHSQTFNTPSLFVNIKFTHISNAEPEDFFVGGKAVGGKNYILANVRGGGDRGAEAFEGLAEKVEDAWDAVVIGTGGRGRGRGKELHACFVFPGLFGRERGMTLPLAGEDGQWLEDNWYHFEEMAKNGDDEFKDLIEEVGKRSELIGK
ncbi:hypothetical protein BJ875DRAFT_522419 [Amylocarpus encephaloides]|uniref:Tautomerase cis-CaaD-like domain-containing protein n=1 Tax=Amylocarpus encephaloides TaxID=45428 RepID=A0A9P7YNX5_9HELO|nr:hypothetical protein BJ875DRAFT_522419 [Amylocarpus encephaloides]